MKSVIPIRTLVVSAVRGYSSTVNTATASIASTIENDPVVIPKTSPLKSFYMKDLETIQATEAELQAKPHSSDNLKFGHIYADHMMEADWNDDVGWTRPLISPLHNFNIHPGAKVLHYAIELFEGMKAYRGVDNRIRLFRAEMNMERMKMTAARASLPDFDGEELIKIISKLVRQDKEWVPYSNTCSLYIRPTLIGTDPTLGVAHSRLAKLFVLTGPTGAYYPTGFQAISLFANRIFVLLKF